MRTQARLWRWRRNPLRRRTDLVEAWAGLAVALLIALGAPLAGVVTGSHVQDSLRRQQLDRHPVVAVLVTDALSVYTETGEGRVRATVRWTASDGSVHRGTAQVEPGGTAGSRSTVWLDDRGRLAGRPMSAAAVEGQACLVGAAAAVTAVALLLAGHGVVRWRLNQRRDREWEHQWAQVGPLWRHRLP